LQIYEAISFQTIVDSGGSTYPWRVMVVDDKKQQREFLAKMFTERQLSQQHAIAKELFGNVLAREFDLPTPEAGLINFSEVFIEHQLGSNEKEILTQKHKGLKFGCEWVNGMPIADPNNLKSHLKEYDLATIFAFDNFVLNLDRGGFRNKPNLLINDDDFLLIDHEQIFYFSDDVDAFHNAVITDFKNDVWNYQAEKHLFYPSLKNLLPRAKKDIFDTFWHYLKDLNVNVLDETASFLTDHNISIGNYDLIKEYMIEIKAKPDKFCNLLMQKIA
jgi:hypothetical protein